MNRWAVGAMGVALLLACAPALRAEPPETPSTPSDPWYTRWFGIGGPSKPLKPEQVKPKLKPSVEAAMARSKAEADLNRRMEVCDRLRQIAAETNNPALDEQANRLEQQAMDHYKKMTAHLPCARLVPSAQEAELDRSLDLTASNRAAAGRLTTPTGDPGRGTASAERPIREVKP